MTIAGIAVGLAIAAAIPPLRDALLDAVHGDTESVREDIRDLGATGVLLVFLLAIVHAVVWYPAEILNAAAGYVYGFGPALPLVMAGWIASGFLTYVIGRHAARPLLYGIAGEERFTRLEGLLERGGATFLLACRLVPVVPFSLTGYVAGAARVPLGRFMWTTAVGFAPITAYFVYLGSRLEGFSATDPIIWIGGVGLILALLGARYLRPRADPRSGADQGG
ncbi:MAG: VTT domain-containing protein [Actinomycetota bacterium]|nr:VTT domain-containing protein [Actinomycetota bacterium]